MLSLESMVERFVNPKSYYLFYDFFYRATIGEQAWKRYMQEEDGSHIGNYTTEAFTLLLLKNNYKAWLHSEKMKHKDKLVTEYEIDKDDTRQSIVDKWLDNVELKYDPEGGEASIVVLKDPRSREYKAAEKARRDSTKKIRDDTELCGNVTRSWSEEEGIDRVHDGGIGQVAHNLVKTREKQKRKLMKSLRLWTGGTGDQPSQQGSGKKRKRKGWSEAGHKVYAGLCEEIRKDKEGGHYNSWNAFIRQTYHEKEGSDNEDEDEEPGFVADTQLVWEL